MCFITATRTHSSPSTPLRAPTAGTGAVRTKSKSGAPLGAVVLVELGKRIKVLVFTQDVAKHVWHDALVVGYKVISSRCTTLSLSASLPALIPVTQIFDLSMSLSLCLFLYVSLL